MWPPSAPSQPPEPPAPPGGPPPGEASPGDPGGHGSWVKRAAIALGIVTLTLVVLAIVLATRPPSSSSATPLALATATPTLSPGVTPTPSSTPSPTPSPTPTATPAPTAAPAAQPNTPVQQAELLYPPLGTECGAGGSYNGCPVTPTLVSNATAWRTNPSHSGDPLPLCRCGSPFSSPRAVEDDSLVPPGEQGPNTSAVHVFLSFSPKAENLVVIFVRQEDGTWLADDTYCPNNLADDGNSLDSGAATSCIGG